MATLGHIRHVSTEDLGAVLRSLTEQSLTFNVTAESDGSWNIEMTGGC